MSLNPYDKDRPCAKCGSDGAATKFWLETVVTPIEFKVSEYMLRTCTNCGALWRELPLDSDQEIE